MDMDFSELNRLVIQLERSTGTVGAAVSAVVRKSAYDIERDAKTFAPVDTGNLRNSISHTITGDGRNGSIVAEIGPTAAYGAFVEYGTSRQAPAAYMGPSFDRNAHLFQSAVGIIAERSIV